MSLPRYATSAGAECAVLVLQTAADEMSVIIVRRGELVAVQWGRDDSGGSVWCGRARQREHYMKPSFMT